ncbi:unnamed protein product, partial [Trichobilharzia szidati]
KMLRLLCLILITIISCNVEGQQRIIVFVPRLPITQPRPGTGATEPDKDTNGKTTDPNTKKDGQTQTVEKKDQSTKPNASS